MVSELCGVAQPEAGGKRFPGGRAWQSGTCVISGAVLAAVTPVHPFLLPPHLPG